MASVTVDSELMTNYVSASPIAAGKHHVAVLDERRSPMLFVLGANEQRQPRLYILRRNEAGYSEHFELHEKIGLANDASIQSFHVEQSWSLKLYLVIATRESDSTSAVKVFKPFLPNQLHADSASLSAISGSRTFGSAETIHMSPISGLHSDNKYPDIFLVHKQLSQIASWGSDISHIQVNKPITRWYATDEFNTPQNVSHILDIAPAVSPYGQGMYVLYVSQGQTRLYARFMRPDPNATDGTMYTFVTDVQCPSSSRCLTSFMNDKGYTCLLIACAQGIQYLTVADSTSKDRPGKLLFQDELVRDVRELVVAQDQKAVTIWFRNQVGELGYIRTTSAMLAETAVMSMLLPAGSSAAFAPVVSARDPLTGEATRQMIVSKNQLGKVQLLEQTEDIGLWRKTPFYAPTPMAPEELKSYTVTIKAKDQNGAALSRGSVYVSASSSLSIILNGRNLLLTKIPTWYDCDTTGSLDLIIPTESLGSQALRIERLRAQDGTIMPDFRSLDYDPAHKPMAQFVEKMQSAHDNSDAFRSLKTATGDNLFDASVANDTETLKAAQKQLQLVSAAYSNTLSPAATTAQMVDAIAKARDSAGSLLMDAWYWVQEKVHEATEWFVDTTGAVWKFVVKIAGKVKEFVLDCVEKICEAASWVWEKVKVGWNKLVDFVGFIFNWDDIKQTKNSISSTINAGFDYAGIKIDDVAVKVDGFFDGLERTIDQFGDGISAQKKISDKAAESSDPKSKDAQSSTQTTWAQERLKNGGAGSDSKADLQGVKHNDDATNFWQQHIVPAFDKLGDQLSTVGTDIVGLFKKDGSIEMNDVLKIGKGVLKAALTAIRGIVKGLFGAVKGLIVLIKKVGNAPIEIPIFSWLWRKISGSPLTLVDAISLIVAIPTTVFAKLITGEAPPDFRSMNGQMMKSLLEDEDHEKKQDWAIFRAEMAVGITLTTGVIGVIKLLYKIATVGMDEVLEELDEGPGSLFDIFGIVVDMVNCLIAIPDAKDLPGAEYRWAISSISYFRGLYHVLNYFAKANEKVTYCLDLVTVLANLGLSIAIGIEEHKAAKNWKDYDEDSTNVGFVSTGLNAVSGIAYFTAFMFKTTNPDISAIGACVMVGAMAGTAVLEGAQFKLQYNEEKQPRLISGASY